MALVIVAVSKITGILQLIPFLIRYYFLLNDGLTIIAYYGPFLNRLFFPLYNLQMVNIVFLKVYLSIFANLLLYL